MPSLINNGPIDITGPASGGGSGGISLPGFGGGENDFDDTTDDTTDDSGGGDSTTTTTTTASTDIGTAEIKVSLRATGTEERLETIVEIPISSETEDSEEHDWGGDDDDGSDDDNDDIDDPPVYGYVIEGSTSVTMKSVFDNCLGKYRLVYKLISGTDDRSGISGSTSPDWYITVSVSSGKVGASEGGTNNSNPFTGGVGVNVDPASLVTDNQYFYLWGAGKTRGSTAGVTQGVISISATSLQHHDNEEMHTASLDVSCLYDPVYDEGTQC